MRKSLPLSNDRLGVRRRRGAYESGGSATALLNGYCVAVVSVVVADVSVADVSVADVSVAVGSVAVVSVAVVTLVSVTVAAGGSSVVVVAGSRSVQAMLPATRMATAANLRIVFMSFRSPSLSRSGMRRRES